MPVDLSLAGNLIRQLVKCLISEDVEVRVTIQSAEVCIMLGKYVYVRITPGAVYLCLNERGFRNEIEYAIAERLLKHVGIDTFTIRDYGRDDIRQALRTGARAAQILSKHLKHVKERIMRRWDEIIDECVSEEVLK